MNAKEINPKSTARETLCLNSKFTGRVLDSNGVILSISGGEDFIKLQRQMRQEAEGLCADFEIGYIQTIDNTTKQILCSQKGLAPDASVAIV